MLLQDPYAAPLHYGGAQPEGEVQALIDRECKMPLVVTDARWNNFRRWARYLGLARTDRNERLIPDPAAAVSEELDWVFRGDRSLPVGEFLTRLAERLPVLDGGRFRKTVVKAALKGGSPDGEVSSALSLALRRLRRADKLELEASHDAPEARVIGQEEITHVSDRRST
jgi:hypothetical protein